MAINLSDNIYTNASKPTDSRYLCNLVPYTTVGQVNTNIIGGVGGVRYTGLTVNITGNEYWYKTGIGDGDLVLKSLGGTITGATNGLTCAGQNISLGGALTGNTDISIDTHSLRITGGTLGLGIDINPNNASLGDYNTMGEHYTSVSDTMSEMYQADAFGNYANLNFNSSGVISMISCIPSFFANNMMSFGDGGNGGICLQSSVDGNPATGSSINIKPTTLTIIGRDSVTIDGSVDVNIITQQYLILNALSGVTLQQIPAEGTINDSVLVRASDGVVKTVSGAALGDNNNIYAKTVVTGNTVLTTGSTYVQLINSSSPITITLPAVPTDGMAFKIKDASSCALENNITVAGNSVSIDGSPNALINTDFGALELMYDSGLNAWFSLAFIN